MDINDREKWVGVIGTRQPTENELRATERLVHYLVTNGFIVVSGLALGIDAKAHQSAINFNGKTIAIVSTTKSENIYPSANRRLANLIRLNGCILHPYSTMAKENAFGDKSMNQFKRRLIERDLILAKLCNKIVAIYDSETINGGTRWAVSYGQKLGKEVYRYDSKGIFHVNPPTSVCDLTWNMEFDMSAI